MSDYTEHASTRHDHHAPETFPPHVDRRNQERANLIAEAKRKNDAARQARIADKAGVIA